VEDIPLQVEAITEEVLAMGEELLVCVDEAQGYQLNLFMMSMW
jgi:hypothetical protein